MEGRGRRREWRDVPDRPYLRSPQLLAFELIILEIFESENCQDILDHQWMLESCHDCS